MFELDEKSATYIQEMDKKPLLTFEEEKELSDIIQERLAIHATIKDEEKRNKAQNADTIFSKAIEKLTTHNLRLVVKESFKFSKSTGVNVKDLIGSGNHGLIKAAYLYNSKEYNNRFSTYATYWIRQAMFDTIHSSGIVSVPVHIMNSRYNHNKLVENGVTDDAVIMDELDVNEKQLKRIRESNVSIVSLDQEIGGNGESDSSTTIGDLIADENADSPYEGAASKDQYHYLYEALSELDDMSRDIISSQILQDDKLQLRELGLRYGKTGERIRQIRDKALKSLRKKIEKKAQLGVK